MESKMLKTQVIYSKTLPAISKLGSELFLICDNKLSSYSPAFAKWSAEFTSFYAVEAGENLKNIDSFSEHIKNIVELTAELNPKELTIVVVGGGSVGDFGGFVASVLKRGVRLVHIPSTWLSAIDSAHGGKTALNVGAIKNQIGTFYQADEVYIIKELLESQPEGRATEALGELIKTAVLDGGTWFKKIKIENMWAVLPDAIKYKYKIVKKDPYEKSGHRQVLNLGHSFGHALEGALHIPHGLAVGYGLRFAIEWSCLRGYVLRKDCDKIKKLMPPSFFSEIKITEKDLKDHLSKDKKRVDGESLTFIFIKGLGKPFRSKVEIGDVVREAKRQGWVE